MENSQPLAATESFSYSWLTERKPPYFQEYNDAMPANSHEKEQNSDFDFPFTSARTATAHADEIFSGGRIAPVYTDRPKIPAWEDSKSAPQSPASSYFSPQPNFTSGNQNLVTGKWKKSSKKLMSRFFEMVKPLVIGVSSKSNSRVDDFGRVQFEASPRPSSAKPVPGNKTGFYHGLKRVRSLSKGPASPMANSPWISPSYNSCTYRSCDVETSIHEAILYCKKSIEK